MKKKLIYLISIILLAAGSVYLIRLKQIEETCDSIKAPPVIAKFNPINQEFHDRVVAFKIDCKKNAWKKAFFFWQK